MVRSGVRVLGMIATVITLGACGAKVATGQSDTGTSGGPNAASGGAAGAGASAGNASGGTGGGSPGSCPSGLPGPALVNVPAPVGSPGYCVDATEVTNGEYAAFLAASYPTSGQAAECSWNTSYTPPIGWPATHKDSYPVVYVDWCDAYAYCKWAGKRLCGKIGGGANAYEDYADATKSEWMSACSAGGTRTYPYGNTYSGAACNGYDNSVVATIPVGSKAACEGGYLGLLDLSGNVWEWEDSCNGVTGDNDGCRVRGGSFFGLYDAPLACGYGDYVYRSYADDEYGFRCCSASR